MDAAASGARWTNDADADGEVVWSWRPDARRRWRQVLRSDPQDDGGKKARSPGSTKEAVKTIARGKPD
jgi:hypothetical protein